MKNNRSAANKRTPATPAQDQATVMALCLEDLTKLFAATDLKPSETQLQALSQLLVMLHKWNAALNLTAIKDLHEMTVLHVLDSAVLAPVLTAQLQSCGGNKVADVGTGAGFPGLVLAILHPEINFTLIDSIAKKLSFVRQVVSALKLNNVELINKRCESIEHEPFDCIVSRAFAPLERMVNWCLPLLKEDGYFIAMKAHLEPEEIAAVPPTVTITNTIELSVPTLAAKRQAVLLQRQHS